MEKGSSLNGRQRIETMMRTRDGCRVAASWCPCVEENSFQSDEVPEEGFPSAHRPLEIHASERGWASSAILPRLSLTLIIGETKQAKS
ncbi:hypothetical protein MRX96_030812 [Rhipicephalus microplus]